MKNIYICFYSIYLMKVDDNYIFQEYHSQRTKGTPFEYFYRSHHIIVSEKRFWTGYERWRKENNILPVIPTYWNYLSWLLDHFNSGEEERYICKKISLSLADIKLNFTELVIATSIFSFSQGYIRSFPGIIRKDVLEAVGLSQETISRCRTEIFSKFPVETIIKRGTV